MESPVTSAVLLVGERTGRRSGLPFRVVESRTLFSRVHRGIEKMSAALKEHANELVREVEKPLFDSFKQETSVNLITPFLNIKVNAKKVHVI